MPAELQPRPRREVVARVVSVVVFTSLSLSVVYASVRLASAPLMSDDPSMRSQSEYALMLIQCAGGLLVMFLPAVVNRRFAIRIPTGMQIAYLVFLYAAIYLGEVRNFYFRIPYWDTVLHFFSGAMLGALGFHLVRVLNDSERRRISLSPGFVAFFAFCFALACGVVWEVYEFSVDGLFGTNMQKFMNQSGELLSGRAALADTMVDLIVDGAAALTVTVIGYLSLRPRTPPALTAGSGSDVQSTVRATRRDDRDGNS